ncbi:2371_t:CDS:2, partial [Cetraspora pellucida]
MPTTTISIILQVSNRIDPIYTNLFREESQGGQFQVINKYFYRDLKKEQLKEKYMSQFIKQHNVVTRNDMISSDDIEKNNELAKKLKELF